MMQTNKWLALGISSVLLASCQTAEPDQEQTEQKKIAVTYPTTKKVDTVDTYFGEEVPDPYRWLEDDLSDETAEWVRQQNEVTFNYLEQIPYRDSIKQRYTELLDYAKYGAPFDRGEYTYYFKNDGLQNQNVLYRKKKGEEQEEVFMDPNQFSEDGTTSLDDLSFTKDGSLVAYSISEGGSDWRKIIVRNTESGERIGDTLRDVKFSGISWRGNEGFYYSSYDKPEEGSQLSGVTQHHKLYFHKLNTPQSEDELIFGDERKRRYINGSVTEDQQYLIIWAAESTTGNELYLKDLRRSNTEIKPIIEGFESEASVVYSEGNTLFIKTNRNAPNGRLVTTRVDELAPENWQDLIPETKNVLNIGTAGGKIFATYMEDATDRVYQFDLEGNMERQIDLPGLGSVGGFGGRSQDSTLYYSFTSYIYPSTTFRYDINSGESEVYRESEVEFDSEQYTSKQVFYQSKDGTRIPMIITHKKGLEMDGSNPTMLYGYGGFNASLTPNFSTSNIILLENGGVYAVANIRGGGEYGEEWHKAGTKMQKQNVFDDFIAAAEYLIDSNYTSKEKLAISGASNGGLLVGAVMTQRPDLMAVAFPAVGVLDMLRYHEFTAGAGWHTDYGTADDSKEMFEYLKGYSPYHNLKKGTSYPATMVTTADHDDRVVPAHSFKFAARLQEMHKGENPVLIRIAVNAGHGAGKPTSMIIQEQADKWSFLFWNMGYSQLPAGQ